MRKAPDPIVQLDLACQEFVAVFSDGEVAGPLDGTSARANKLGRIAAKMIFKTPDEQWAYYKANRLTHTPDSSKPVRQIEQYDYDSCIMRAAGNPSAHISIYGSDNTPPRVYIFDRISGLVPVRGFGFLDGETKVMENDDEEAIRKSEATGGICWLSDSILTTTGISNLTKNLQDFIDYQKMLDMARVENQARNI